MWRRPAPSRPMGLTLLTLSFPALTSLPAARLCAGRAEADGGSTLLFMRRRFQQCTDFQPRYPRNNVNGLSEHLLDRAMSVVVPCYLPNEQ
jgi:hypothetical protein